MYGKLLALILLSIFLISSHGQYNDDRDLPPAPYQTDRGSKISFDTLFPRGRCPERFYQSGEECLYFSNDGKIYSWHEAERVCSRRVARMLQKHSASDMNQINMNQPNMVPTKGVRQLVLNTPEKTAIFQSLSREYNEQNFAVRLPSDYNTLQRCRNAKDDKWPQFCINPQYSNATCFETVSNDGNEICLREIECRQRYLRVACEFTLPGSAELTDSKFRHCPKARGLRHRLPLWAWILVAVGGALLLLAVIIAILGCICKSKRSSPVQKRTLPEPRHTEEKIVRVTTKRDDPAREPMINRPAPPNPTNSDYLQPRSSAADKDTNA